MADQQDTGYMLPYYTDSKMSIIVHINLTCVKSGLSMLQLLLAKQQSWQSWDCQT